MSTTSPSAARVPELALATESHASASPRPDATPKPPTSPAAAAASSDPRLAPVRPARGAAPMADADVSRLDDTAAGTDDASAPPGAGTAGAAGNRKRLPTHVNWSTLRMQCVTLAAWVSPSTHHKHRQAGCAARTQPTYKANDSHPNGPPHQLQLLLLAEHSSRHLPAWSTYRHTRALVNTQSSSTRGGHMLSHLSHPVQGAMGTLPALRRTLAPRAPRS